MNRFGPVIFRTLLIATFAVWFGGFTFYVSFVVPIGTEVLGSAREQGFITRQVTPWLNLMCGASIALMMAHACFSWSHSSRLSKCVQLTCVIAIALLLAVLILLHPKLDTLLDLSKMRVVDRARFYQLHRGYLWASTFQWIFGWIWLVFVMSDWSRENPSPDAAKTPAAS